MLRKFIIQFIVLTIFAIPTFADFNPLDPTFKSNFFALDPADYVQKILVQSDGKILIGGQFTKYNNVDRKNIVRLNANGTIDETFNPGTGANNKINDMILLSTGKILVAGNFTEFNGVSTKGIIRLNTNGSVDQTFTPPALTILNTIKKIGLLSNGQIMISGAFVYTINGANNWSLARLNSTGTIDQTFSSGDKFSWVENIALQSDNKIIVSGFTTINGTRYTLVRVNLDGSIDNTFVGEAGDKFYQEVKIQADGKIIIAGNFTLYKGVEVNGIARILSNGNLDATFNPEGTGLKVGDRMLGIINNLTIQADGKIIAAGNLVSYNNISARSIVRLTSNGVPDPTFNAPYVSGINNINTVALQADGKILIGGPFSAYENNVRVDFIGRLLDCLAPDAPVNTTTKTTYCRDDLGELSVSGNGTMKWYTTRTGTTPVNVGAVFNKPVTFSSYYVESSNSCATNPTRTTINITLNSTPVTVALGTSTVCAGESVTLRGGSSITNVRATSFSWSDGIEDQVSFVPTQTKTYTVTGTANNGCSSTDTITVIIKPSPNVTASASSDAVCSGSSVTLTSSGATTYSWSDAVVNGVSFVPIQTKTYTVTGTTNNCKNTANITVEVKPLPNTNVITSTSSISSEQDNATYQWISCRNDSVMLEEMNQVLVTNDSHEYKVIITLDGCVDSSACVTRELSTTGFNNPYDVKLVTIYPNPSNGVFTIEAAQSGNYSIVNEMGQIITSFTVNGKNNYSVDLQNINHGIYYLVKNQEESHPKKRQKIVIIK